MFSGGAEEGDTEMSKPVRWSPAATETGSPALFSVPCPRKAVVNLVLKLGEPSRFEDVVFHHRPIQGLGVEGIRAWAQP